jgi:Ca2+-binding EF-hand superfamily protein
MSSGSINHDNDVMHTHRQLRDHLASFAAKSGYALPQQDLNLVLNEVTGDMKKKNLMINPDHNKRMERMRALHLKASGARPSRPTSSRASRRSSSSVRIRVRENHLWRPNTVSASDVKRPMHLQRKFGLGATVRATLRPSSQSSANRARPKIPPSITPSLRDRSLTQASHPTTIVPPSSLPENKRQLSQSQHRSPTNIVGGNDKKALKGGPRNIKMLPVGHEALLKMMRQKVIERSKSTRNPVIWLRKQWLHFDKDKNNIIDAEEFSRGVRAMGFPYVAQTDIDDVFKHKFDVKQEGCIRFEFFMQTLTPQEFESNTNFLNFNPPMSDDQAVKEMKKDFAKAIHTYSRTTRGLFVTMAQNNRQGKVTKAELKRVMTKFGIGVGNDRGVDLLFAACDLNGDGVITYDELAQTINQKGFATDLKAIPMTKTKARPIPCIGAEALHKIISEVLLKRGTGQNELARTFRSFDKNHDETIDINEFRRVIKNYFKITGVNDQDILDLFEEYDQDKGGHINYHTFINALMPSHFEAGENTFVSGNYTAPTFYNDNLDVKVRETKKRIKEQSILKFKNVRQFFLKMDKSGLGKFTRQQLKAALRKEGIGHLQESALDEIFDRADVNKDGVVDYEEFMRNLLELDGPDLHSLVKHKLEPAFAVEKFDELPMEEKLARYKTQQKLITGNFDTKKAKPSKPCPDVIRGIFSADNPPWAEWEAREKAKNEMYKTAQSRVIGHGERFYTEAKQSNVHPTAIRWSHRPLSIPSKLEVNALTLKLANKNTTSRLERRLSDEEL